MVPKIKPDLLLKDPIRDRPPEQSTPSTGKVSNCVSNPPSIQRLVRDLFHENLALNPFTHPKPRPPKLVLELKSTMKLIFKNLSLSSMRPLLILLFQ